MDYTLYLYRWICTNDDPLDILAIERDPEPVGAYSNVVDAMIAREISWDERDPGESWELHLVDGRILPHAWEDAARNAADVAYCTLVDEEER